ncbi:MAG: hypothetical protein ABJF01_16850 [bacterium]
MGDVPTRRRPTLRRADALTNFLRYLEDVARAVLGRDALGITALLRKRTATHLPREVREELLMLSRAPRDSLRAPVQFFRFQHRMTQLAVGGERLPTAQTELQLDPLAPAGVVRLPLDGDRRIAALNPAGNTREDAATDSSLRPPKRRGRR